MTPSVDAAYRWIPELTPPAELPVVQVYGILLDEYGRMAVLRDGDRWNLPGGSPGPLDADHAATLVREAREEIQAEVTEPGYLGYQEAVSAGSAPCAQVRMVARLTALAPREPDPDKGYTLVRRVCAPTEALGLLGWGPEMGEQVAAAQRVAAARWGLPSGEGTTGRTD